MNSVLRGGPSLKLPGYLNFNIGFNSNRQKKITASFSTAINKSLVKDYRKNVYLGIGLGYRPSENLNINISPGISRNHENLQYVTQKDYLNNTKYIMARINRNTVNMSIRFDYNITPDISIQYWAQPFIAAGEYTEYKYITNSLADKLTDRYQIYSTNQINFDPDSKMYLIDDNNDGTTDYQFDKPDFNIKEFLSNLVLRWEYQPGSTFYLVWSQTRNHSHSTGNFHFANNMDDLFDVKGHNIFLVKFSYRIGR